MSFLNTIRDFIFGPAESVAKSEEARILSLLDTIESVEFVPEEECYYISCTITEVFGKVTSYNDVELIVRDWGQALEEINAAHLNAGLRWNPRNMYWER